MTKPKEPLIRCVGAVVFDPFGRLLLVKRGHEPEKGKWSLPGGRVKPGETDEAAVQREIQEETGLSVIVGPLVGRICRPAPKGTYVILDYSCWSNEQELLPGDDAVEAIWADTATFTTFSERGALTTGLADTLRTWGCLPRDR